MTAALAAPVQLRPYQVEQVASVCRELERVRSTLVVAATGTGKTVSLAELTRLTASRGGRTLILVNRDELVRQTVRKCEAVGLSPDIEKASMRASTLAKVVIASVQTLRGKRLQRWARDHFALVIVDECHHAVAAGYVAILAHFDAAKVVGYTATPYRTDGKALGEVFETVAHRYEIRQAIHDKHLVPIIARRVVVDGVDLSGVKERAGDFAQDQLAAVMESERALRGQAVPLLDLCGERLTVAYGVDVAHAEALARTLNALRPGIARAVSGRTDDDEREATLAAFQRGEFQILCNCDLLVEGWDCPEVSCVAICRPTKSLIRFVQCAGRGLRPAPWIGKRDCLVLTFGDGKTPGLIGPADCLAGRVIDDDLRDEIDRLIGNAQLSIEPIIAQAENELAKRRDAMRLHAVVKWHAEHVDPFLGAEPGPAAGQYGSDLWRREPASKAQIAALEREGVTISKLPALTRAEAWDLLSRIRSRQRKGLCSYRAARKLHQAGVRDTATLTHERAKQLLDKLRAGGWRPSAIAGEPETLPEYATPSGRAWGVA
jgi:superfamily II DNA or RNA helicase